MTELIIPIAVLLRAGFCWSFFLYQKLLKIQGDINFILALVTAMVIGHGDKRRSN